jgi:HEPN domain-containing protein
LVSAEALLLTAGIPAWSIAFHLQQCAEKYLKALLTALGTGFPKSHDIGELIALLPRGQRPPLAPALVADLTEYATAGRYPGRPEPTVEEAQNTLEAVRALRTWVRERLPAAALGQP